MTMPVTDTQYLAAMTAIGFVTFLYSSAMLIAFRRGRLRIYNIVAVFVLALFAGVYYLKFGARQFNLDLEKAAWTFYAACGGYGAWAMTRLARTDRPIWDKRGVNRPTRKAI